MWFRCSKFAAANEKVKIKAVAFNGVKNCSTKDRKLSIILE
jgi:hypothetical protein